MAYDVTTKSEHAVGGITIKLQRDYSVGGFLPFNIELGAEVSNQLCTVAFNTIDLKSIILTTPVDLYISCNGPMGDNDQVLEIASAVGIVWDVDGGFPCPFNQNITSLFFTNGEDVNVPATEGGPVIKMLIGFNPMTID